MPSETQGIALGDQVQELLTSANLGANGFVILFEDGTVEYRSPYQIEEFRVMLKRVAEAL